MSRFQPGVIIHELIMDQLLLLINRFMRENLDGTAEEAWNVLNLSTGERYWIWEHHLLDNNYVIV